VGHIGGVSDEDAAKVWDLIDAWSHTVVDDAARAELRERIRRHTLTRRGYRQGLKDAIQNRARDAYNKLEPSDFVMRHDWLFAKRWIEESADELEVDYTKSWVF
jgi:hypothetical protein